MIPKKINYIWLGKAKKNNLINACIVSWKQYMPDYEIIEWNEENLDIEKLCKENKFFKECYKRKMYAFMADYIRLKILYEYGGIYFDTDIQVIKKFDDLLDKKLVIGIEKDDIVNTAVICAEPHNEIIKKMIDFYDKDIWIYPIYTIPAIMTKCINSDSNKKDIDIMKKEYFYPFYYNEEFKFDCITENTYTIHWWSGMWTEKMYTIFLNTKHIKNPIKRKIVCVKKLIGYYYRKCFVKGNT